MDDPVAESVQRWNGKFDEHRASFLHEEEIAETARVEGLHVSSKRDPSEVLLPEDVMDASGGGVPAATSTDPALIRAQKKKKLLSHRKNDPPTINYCLDAANAHIEKSQTRQNVFQAPFIFGEDRPTNPAEMGPSYSLYSNAMAIRDFSQTWRRKHYEQAANQHKTVVLDEEVMTKQVVFTQKKQLPLDFLQGQNMPEKMKSLFDSSQRYYNSKIDKDQPAAVNMPVDSSHAIARLLVLHNPSRPFRACLNSRWGICQATMNMPHPFDPSAPLIAYYTEADYLKVSQGETLPPNMANSGQDDNLMAYEQLCEFCYRAFVSSCVQDSKAQKHRATAEIPFRYYRIGVGEYSKDGMYQQASLTKANFSHGIVGNMRLWTVKDFIPCMMRFSADNRKIIDFTHFDEYQTQLSEGTLNPLHRWTPGWREVGPFHAENENNLREVKQTQPYLSTFTTTAREPSVGTLLDDYFTREAKPNRGGVWEYAHLFRDLYDCLADPQFMTRKHYRSKNNRWKLFCVHQFESPPPEETHQVYYIVLAKVNTLRKLISVKNELGLTKYIQQKIQAYLTSYHPLLALLQTATDYSDDALLSNMVPDRRLGVWTCLLNTVYPLPLYHQRSGDQSYYRMAVHRYRRANPLEVCDKFYSQRTLPPLFRLPYSYDPDLKELELVVDELGPVLALESYEEAIQELRKSFTANMLAIRTYGVQFKWRECIIKKQRKPNPPDSAAGPPPPPPKKLGPRAEAAAARNEKAKQRAKVIRTLSTMSESARQNFVQLETWVGTRTGRYHEILGRYTDLVFCDFEEGVSWIAPRIQEVVAPLLEDFKNFTSLIPPQIVQRVKLDLDGVNSVPWTEYTILLTLLLRVAVLEELHALEPYTRTRLRYNLVLLRNSHLKLFRKIFEQPDSPLVDSKLLGKYTADSKITILEYYYPHPERELHEGSLPDYVNGLEMVNFFADCGMDQFPWSKLQYKMPDRCCDVREYSMMLRNFCSDSTFYRWTLLALRLSLSGLYSHCTVAPCFARSVSLDELFDQSLHERMKPTIIQFILNNESLVLNAMSESLCYQLELMPGLLEMLNDLYRDWFSWRVFANMDMIRHLYSCEGNFRSVWEVVFVRAHLKGMRTLFRLSEVDWVVWLCGVFKRADDNRHKKGGPRLPKSAAVSPTLDTVIQNLILQLDPNQILDIRVLRVIGIKKKQLHNLHTLYRAFSAQNLLNMDQDLPPELANYALNTKQLIELVQSIPPAQYLIMCHFFTLLRHYQSVRAIKLRNSNILERQLKRISERTGAGSLAEVPRFAFCCAFSFCCKHVKNSWSSKPGTLSTGYEDIFYNLEDDIYVCAKKIHQQNDEVEDEDNDESNPDQGLEIEPPMNITGMRKSDRELRRPVCIRTEPFTVFLPGYLVEADGFKIPGTKRVSLDENGESVRNKASAKAAAAAAAAASAAAPPVSAQTTATGAPKAGGKKQAAKKQVFELPLPGYWITPCCGIPFEYDFNAWTPADYQCRFCPQGIAMHKSFNELNCSACHLRVIGPYLLLKVYDDVYELRTRRVIFCKGCTTPLRRVYNRYPLFSLLLSAISDSESLADIIDTI